MHIYILGICGTFMGSLAILAREAGFTVSGCDANVYPPMSTQLETAGIRIDQGFEPNYLTDDIDLVVIGNALSRGNAMVEAVLNQGLAYTSGPQFLHDYILRDKWVLAVSGTHGKTTTSAMLAWILEYAGLKPGFLIGGALQNFPFSARLGDGIFFVVEADEYDTAFFDKRSKFLHYRPQTLILNNLEFDHADIFENLAAIKKQFHHLLRIVPSIGQVVVNNEDANLHDVLGQGLWAEKTTFGQAGDWQIDAENIVSFAGQSWPLTWQLLGEHNQKNALAAIAAAYHAGVKPEVAVAALGEFTGVKRRMEQYAKINNITLYDDFAHHPTAIETTLKGLRAKVDGRILAVLEPRSNTMKMGVHQATLAASVQVADKAFWYVQGMEWSLEQSAGEQFTEMNALLQAVVNEARAGDHIVLMSNGSFSGLHQKLAQQLEQKYG